MACLTTGLLSLNPLVAARAQSTLSRDEQNLVNFGFATQLGSGVYTFSGRTLQIYRIPFSYTLRSVDTSKFGVELTLPLTVGFYDFKLKDVAEAQLPDHIDAVSFVPGVTLVFAPQPDWLLEPFIEGGIARLQDTLGNTRVYAGGLRSLYTFQGRGFDWLLRNELLYAGLDFSGTTPSDHFVRLQTTLTARRRFTRDSTFDYLLYAMNEIYFDQPGAPVNGSVNNGSPVQYEIGITIGTAETHKIWGIPLPRLGIGYRFGDHLSVWRIVLDTPY